MFETQGRTRNRARDLPKKGSAFITSSDHWTNVGEAARMWEPVYDPLDAPLKAAPSGTQFPWVRDVHFGLTQSPIWYA